MSEKMYMTEKEKEYAKKITEKVGAAVPKMSEFQKGYFLGAAEAVAERCSIYKNSKTV